MTELRKIMMDIKETPAQIIVVRWPSVPATRHQWAVKTWRNAIDLVISPDISSESKTFDQLTVFGVVGHKVILDGKEIGVHNGRVFQLYTQLIAEAA